MTHLRVVNWILLFVPLRGVTMAFALFIFAEVDSFSVPLRGVTACTWASLMILQIFFSVPLRGVTAKWNKNERESDTNLMMFYNAELRITQKRKKKSPFEEIYRIFWCEPFVYSRQPSQNKSASHQKALKKRD